MAANSFFCQFCDCTLSTKKEYEQHCKGKKHISNECLAHDQEAANRKLFVRGHNAIKDAHDNLKGYFDSFGKVENISFSSKSGNSYAVVEFSRSESVAKALKVKHKIGGRSLYVKKFEYRPPHWESQRLAHQELERGERAKQAETKNHMMEILLSADNLTDQISLVAQSLQLDDDDKKARVQICDELTRLFTHHFENYKIYQFGSSINGFGAKGSDLDLFLDLNGQDFTNGGKNKIKKLAQVISSSPSFTKPLTIPSSRCPVVRFVHKSSDIKCDLSINNRKALHNSSLLKLYSSDPRVHKLVSVVRLWAKSQGLSGSSELFTSYALTLIVLFFIMRRKPQIIPLVCEVDKCVPGTHWEMVDDWPCLSVPHSCKLPPSKNEDTDVELVKEFFAFCSGSINWDTQALVLRDAKIIQRSSISLNPSLIGCKAGCMTVLDPFVLTHNVVANINEKTKVKFVAAVKRATELTSDWPALAQQSRSGPWGIAALLVQSPEQKVDAPSKKTKKRASKNQATGEGQKEDPAKSAKNRRNRVEGEQDNGEFCITVRPLAKMMSCDKLLLIAKQNHVGPAEQWCIMAQKLILKILKTVFRVEVEEGEEKMVEAEVKNEVAQDILRPMPICDEAQGSLKEVGHLNESLECSMNVGVFTKGKGSDNSRNKVDERRIEAEDTSCGKRSSDAAHLDGNGAELAEDSIKVSNSLPGDSYQNPKKKFCERVFSICDQSNEEHVSSKTLFVQDSKAPSSVSGDLSKNVCSNIESPPGSSTAEDTPAKTDHSSSNILTGSPTYSGPITDIKTSKIVSYFCRCKHQLWMNRKKLFSQLQSKNSLSGLALEQEITNVALKKQKACETDLSKGHKNEAEHSKGNSTPEQSFEKMAPFESERATEETKTQSIKIGQGAEPKDEAKSNQNRHKEVQTPCIEFTCQILHQNSGSSIPHILLKLRPTDTSSNQFKNFYCSFRSLVLHLVMENLLDVYS